MMYFLTLLFAIALSLFVSGKDGSEFIMWRRFSPCETERNQG
jgi:hypothetical protein